LNSSGKAASTLQVAAEDSPGIRKLYDICTKLFRIASTLVAEKRLCTGPVDEVADKEVLSALQRAINGLRDTTAFQSSLDVPLFVQDWDTVLDGWNFWLGEGNEPEFPAKFLRLLGRKGEVW
jgi:hypothetical protein